MKTSAHLLLFQANLRSCLSSFLREVMTGKVCCIVELCFLNAIQAVTYVTSLKYYLMRPASYRTWCQSVRKPPRIIRYHAVGAVH